MRLENMTDRIEKGLVTVSREGDAFKITSKQFDPNTGEELSPEVVAFDLETAQKDIAERQTGIEGLKVLLEAAKKL